MIPEINHLFDSDKYYFNPHALPLFASAGLIALLGGKVLASGRSRTNFYFGIFSLSIIAWLVFTALGYLVKDDVGLATFWFQLDWVGVSFISVSVYAFAVYFVGKTRPVSICLGYSLGFAYSGLILTAHPMMSGVRKFPWGFFPLHDHRWSPVFFVFFFGYMILAFINFFRAYQETLDPNKRNQIKYIFCALAVAYLGSIDFLPTHGVSVYPFGFLFISLFVGITAYAILRHQLMDISIIIQKTLLYSLVSAALASIYVGTITLIVQVLGGRQSPASVFSSALAAIFITLLFNPLRMRIQKWIDRHFPRERLDPELLQEAAGGFAHEMKRPLAKISMPAELTLLDLERVKSGEKTWEEFLPVFEQRLRFIVNQSIDAGYMIEAIRELSISSAAPFVPVDLADTIRHALNVEKELLEKRKISVQLHVPEALQGFSGRRRQLEIVFLNLIKNAAEAMSELPTDRSREIRIEAVRDKNHVLIRVKDSGPGIRPEDKGKIFQAHYSTKGLLGTGMGLYLASQIIHVHNGTIEISSQPGQGTEFRIYLPSTKG